MYTLLIVACVTMALISLRDFVLMFRDKEMSNRIAHFIGLVLELNILYFLQITL